MLFLVSLTKGLIRDLSTLLLDLLNLLIRGRYTRLTKEL